MTSQNLVSRKDLAVITGLTVDIIRGNEARFGLDKCKVQWNKRGLRYQKEKAIEALKKAGVL